MTDLEIQAMRKENDYLKLRNAQLQADLTDLSSETERLRQMLERLDGRVRHSAQRPGERSMSLFDLFRTQAITAGQLRQEIYLLGGRHQGDALAGARAELQDGGLSAERRALLRAVESHLAAGKSAAVDGTGRAATGPTPSIWPSSSARASGHWRSCESLAG